MGQLKGEKEKMKNASLATILGYIGALFMVAFSFTLNPYLAVTGLILITFQSVNDKIHNITAINLVSIIGFISQLVK